MSSIGENQEARIMSGLHGMLHARVQSALPANQRGVRARGPIDERLASALSAALDRVVEEVATEVAKAIDPLETPFAPKNDPAS